MTGRIYLDYETRSHADLGKVGVWNYSLDVTTDIICMCYRIRHADDSRGDVQAWVPGSAMPSDLRLAVESGYVTEAHNYQFELSIWNNICVPRYGFCEVNPEQWRCTMAVANYYAMPPGLDALLKAIGMPGKDSEGSRLISKYSKLYLKTSKQAIPPDDLHKFIEYCKIDVLREEAVSDYLGDLPGPELEIFQLDQLINLRGLGLTLEGISTAKAIVDQRAAELTERFRELTGLNPTQGAKLIAWFGERGLTLDTMQAEYLEDLIKEGKVPEGSVREALDIRLRINKASTKKLDAMLRNRALDGRARWQCRYHGTVTGRWAGAGFQPLNLTRGMEDVAPEQLVRDIMLGSPKYLDAVYGDATDAVSKASRHWIVAKEGHRLLAGDFVSIEAVILSCLAGEDWKINAFREGKKLYELTADKVFGLPEGTVTKKTHPVERQTGKTCLGASTQVLTKRGYVAIIDVTSDDLLWDGEKWTKHEGLIYQGQKATIDWRGVAMTPDHQILCGREWLSGEMVNSSEAMSLRALATGSENLPLLVSKPGQGGEFSQYGSNARVEHVYDLANAGPLRRFTILTGSGPVIVHNCELAFGYQGSLGAWLKFDSSGRYTDERILEINKAWRAEHPAIVALWAGMECAALEAIRSPGKTVSYRAAGFQMVDEWLSMILPNGKRLWYYDPKIIVGMPNWHKPSEDKDCKSGSCRCRPAAGVTHMTWKEGQWKRMSTYGGKFTAELTQGTAREYLIPSIKASERYGYPVVLSVYDEVVAEAPISHGSKEEYTEILRSATGRDWAKDWPIGVESWAGSCYRK
jgi:hypothetical protein